MDKALTRETCAAFADALAAKASVPGGGGAAAYAGALAAALGNMVGNFTVGKKAYAAVEDDMRRLLVEGDAARARLLALVDEDAAAFEPLARAYGIAADDPTRADALEEATRGALQPPLETMRQVVHVVELLEEMGEKGSRMLLSDVGCGAALAAAALRAASMNVFVNTKGLRDRALADEVEAECDELLACASRADALADRVAAKLRS
mgnify:CR=1 FL=1